MKKITTFLILLLFVSLTQVYANDNTIITEYVERIGDTNFSDTIEYNDGEKFGTLYKQGSSEVVGEIPEDTKLVEDIFEIKTGVRYTYIGGKWGSPKSVYDKWFPDTINFNKDGYIGTLLHTYETAYLKPYDGNNDFPQNPNSGDTFVRWDSIQGNRYRGQVTKPAISIYRQQYIGIASFINRSPNLNITQPITNQRIGNQDNLIINGTVKDEDVGDILTIKYSINNIGSSNVTLTQPTSITSNGHTQSFQGYIKLNNLSSGDNNLKVWAEDNKGAKSNIVEVPIIAFNTLENVMKSLKSYTYKSGEPQYLVVNSSNTITQSIDNDNLISQIKRELEAKNIKLFFIGKDGTTESYINTKLLSN